MDKGYPKEIIKGFGGLGGKVTAVLSVSGIKTRPESVYFFKPGKQLKNAWLVWSSYISLFGIPVNIA